MKYVVFLGDGMADTPVKEIGGKTPLMVAKKETIDTLAGRSEVGLAKTVPDGMKPGSDTANLAVMGYNPKECYSGRSPLEALSMGITLADTDIAVRCNLVTLSSKEEIYADKTMVDYSAGEISTEESGELIRYIQEHLGDERISFHAGISYRHCLIVHDASTGSELTPPHDITGKKIKRHLPSGKLGELFLDLQMKSYDLLKDHPINLKRIEEGKNPANSIWLWGEGTKPNLPDFQEKNGIKGAVISAVDLLKGIGKGAGMEVIDVPGATGNVHTDFAAKGRAAIDALGRVDYVYIHVEAPDESGHQGSLEDKITSIEKIDSEICAPVLAYLKECGEPYHILVCPDHPTPLAVRTHTADPIPYLLYKSDDEKEGGVTTYDEESAKSTGIFIENGYTLIDRLLSSEPAPTEEGISPDLVTMPDSGEEIRLTEETSDENGDTPENAEAAPEEGEKAESAGEEKNEAKPKKKGKFGAFFKKHLGAFLIAIAVLLVAGGLTAGHFIATYHLAFIRSEEELFQALSKEEITTLVFKKDVTVSKDLTAPRSFNVDLNEYTLTVNGDLRLAVKDETYIGYKKGKTYVRGGKIIANRFFASGTGTLFFYADIEATESEITASKADIRSDIAGEDTVTTLHIQEVSYEGKAEGTLALADTTELTFNAEAKEIRGGKSIELHSGAVESITGSATVPTEVYLYEDASVVSVKNVGDFFRVTQLATPDKIILLQENGEYRCYISEVIGAEEYSYSLNWVQKDPVKATPGTTVITLKAEDMTLGKQTLAVKATAPQNKAYLESENKLFTFDFSAQLDTPAPTVKENEDGSVFLNIPAIKNADKYAYTIDGNSYTTSTTETEITDKVTAGGVHIVEVTAQSENEYLTDSNTAMTSYVHYLVTDAPIPTITLTKDDNDIVFTWEAAEGATSYLIRYGTDEIYTTSLSITLPYISEASFSIQTIGGDYYKDSTVRSYTAAQITTELTPATPAQ